MFKMVLSRSKWRKGLAKYYCNKCKSPMVLQGQVRAGPSGGLKKLYMCPICEHIFIEM